MLPSNLKEGTLAGLHQEVGGHQEGSLLPKDPLQDVTKIKGMKGTLEDHLQGKIPTDSLKGDMMIDQDLNILKERGNIGSGHHKEGNIKNPRIEEGDIRHNKEENIPMSMIEEEDIHLNKERTHGLNIDETHKVNITNKEWHRKFHLDGMQNPGIGDLLRDKEKEAVVAEEIFARIAEGKFTVIPTAVFYVDGAWKLRKEELHLASHREMIIPRGKNIKVNRKEEALLRDGKDRWRVKSEDELLLPGRRGRPGIPRNPRENPKKKEPGIDLHVKIAEILAFNFSQMVWEDVQGAVKDSDTAVDPHRLDQNKSTNNLSVLNVIVKIYNSFWMEEVFAPTVKESFDGRSEHPRKNYLK